MNVIGDQEDKEPIQATAEKGEQLVNKAIEEVTRLVQGMLDGTVRHEITGL